MVKNKFGGEARFSGGPRPIERGTPEYFARILESHIKYFIPSGWREAIHVPFNVSFYIEVADWLAYKKAGITRPEPLDDSRGD